MKQHTDSIKSKFVGKKITSAILTNKENVAQIDFQDGSVLRIEVEGDCCSHSVFYAIDTPPDLNGAIILDLLASGGDYESECYTTADSKEKAIPQARACGMKIKETPDEDEDEYFNVSDVLKIWNVVIKTDRGDVLIRHINCSNGYYDGDVSLEFESGADTYVALAKYMNN